MLNLYLVRHGETEWNREERIQGRLDSRLTEKGQEYAKLLGKRLQEVPFDHLISSPSQRTLETARLIRGNREIMIQEDHSIMEMDMGPWQGLTKEEIKRHYPNEHECFMERPHEYQNANAETFADMHKRSEDFLNRIRSLNGNLLVITHGLFIKTLYTIFKEIDIKDIWTEATVEGTSLTIIKLDQDHTEIVLQGDMSHITEKSASQS